MDPDQDILDQLDRREAGRPIWTVSLAGGFAALAGIITYFTFTVEVRATAEIAGDAAVLVMIVSAGLLAVSHFRFR